MSEVAPRAVELVLESRALLGEGPIWDARSQRLVFVDILGKAIHVYDPASGAHETVDTGQAIGAVGLREAGGLILALERGFAVLDPVPGGIPSMVAEVEADDTTTRFNDGRCDATGRFWAGTMAYNEEAGRGTLYKLDPDHSVEKVLSGVTISNGLDWSADNRTMYYIDSPTHNIDAFDFDLESGRLSARRHLIEIPPEAGLPDGMVVDEDGFIWVALWGGHSVRRYSPEGRLDRTVYVPVSRVTSCAFGGPDREDLYITSASVNLTEAELAAEPLAGSLFRYQPGVSGRWNRLYLG